MAKGCWNAYAAAFSWVAAAALSNRGIAFATLLASLVFITGPWLRSSVSRDFRGPHIPWNDSAQGHFLPENVSQAPRPWRWDSIAVPLAAVVGVGMIVVAVRPRWTSHVFGVLLGRSAFRRWP
jgi:hypothetical protein